MDEDLKKGLKSIAKNAELKVAQSILRWKYKKEGKKVPDQNIGQQSKVVADQAHQIIAKRGRNIWQELKEAYRRGGEKEDSGD